MDQDGWIKYFGIGEPEYGLDNYVAQHMASWRNGRLDNMNGARIQHGSLFGEIRADRPGTFWQSDGYEAGLSGNSALVGRRIQKLITADDLFLVCRYIREGMILHTQGTTPKNSPWQRNVEVTAVQNRNIGKWLTVEIDLKESIVNWHLANSKI